MVSEKRAVIPELSALLAEIRSARAIKTDEMKPTAVFFISFDITNSTAYKTAYPDTWSNTMQAILRQIISSFEISTFGGYSFWKSLGDEIVYTKKITKLADIPTMLDAISANLDRLNKMIDNATLCDREASRFLGIKATAWLCDVSSSAKYTRNVFTQYDIKDNRKQMNFAGPAIDIGFRVSKYSMKNRLVISCGLAYMLLKVLDNDTFEKKVNVVAQRPLEGVWNGKPYPIIVYHANDKVSFDNSIVDCDSDKGRCLRDYLENKPNYPVEPPYFCHSQKSVLQAMETENRMDRVDNIIEIIENQEHCNFIEIAGK